MHALPMNLSSIVVCLFPLVEQTNDIEVSDDSSVCDSILIDWGRIPNLRRKHPYVWHPTHYYKSHQHSVSNALLTIADAINAKQLSALYQKDARSKAIDIIKHLFLTR